MKPAFFLDRDGVLNVDHGYVFRWQDWQWVDGALDAIRLLNRLDYAVVVVTNQSGVGRGYYSEEDVRSLHRLVARDAADHAAAIDGFYYCPHGPDDLCECRKPKPGMLLAAARDLGLDLKRSWLVGDKPTDVEAATAAGVRGALFEGGNLRDFVAQLLEVS